MVYHAALSSEDVVVVAAGTDALILMIYSYLTFMVKRRWVLDTRMTNALTSKQFVRMLVNVYRGIIDLFFHYDILRGLNLKPPHKLSLCMTISY